ncbi:MAG TPA: SAV_2336 N-terminal domain-related protein, partial [Gemmata sp.]
MTTGASAAARELLRAMGLKFGADFTAEDIAHALWLAPQLHEADARAPEPPPVTTPDESPPATTPDESPPATRSPEPVAPAPEEKPLPARPREPELNVRPVGGPASGRPDPPGVDLAAPAPLKSQRELARALRPLLGRSASRRQRALDIPGTVRRIAEQDLWEPVTRPTRGRWLRLDVVFDLGPSMEVWRPTMRALYRFIHESGAFPRARVWAIDTARAEPVLTTFHPRRWVNREQPPRRPKELLAPGAEQLILVVTDAVSRAWWTGAAGELLGKWTGHALVALAQVLPDYLWVRTALGPLERVTLRATARATPNRYLCADPPGAPAEG